MASLPPSPASAVGVAVGRQRSQLLPWEKETATPLHDRSRPSLSLPTLNHQQQPRHQIVVDNRQWRSGNSNAEDDKELKRALSLHPQEALSEILLALSETCSSLRHLEQQQQQQPDQQAGTGEDSPVVECRPEQQLQQQPDRQEGRGEDSPVVVCWPLSVGSLYVPLLQQCVVTRSVSSARSLHSHLVKTGFYNNMFLSTSLINVYGKCGLVDEARKVFDKLPVQNIVAWTNLITGHSHNGQPEQALLIFMGLLESGRYPTPHTLASVLRVCATLYALNVGHQVHAYAVKYGSAANVSVASSLSNMYSKCRDLKSCLKVFRNIPDKDRTVILWTTAINACSDNGRADLGLRIFNDMLRKQGQDGENVMPNDFTLTSVMSLCCTSQYLDLGKQIHSLCIRLGNSSSLPISNAILYLYMKCGQVEEARKLMKYFNQEEDDDDDNTPSSTSPINLITWNAMIAGFAHMMDDLLSIPQRDEVSAYARGIESLRIFSKLNRRHDMRPDLYSYSSVLNVCSSLAALDQGEQIHAQVIKTGYLSEVVVGSALVNMYSKCGMIQKAIDTFAELPTRTLISWTSMITAYSQHGRSKEAIQLFEDMRLAGVEPNLVTFVAVLSACSHQGMVDQAHHYFRLMTDSYGIKPVMDHYGCMVDLYARLGRLEEAFSFINTEMPFEPNEVIWSIILAGCKLLGKTDLAVEACQRLLRLSNKSPEAYAMLLNTYAAGEKWQEFSKIKRIMKNEKIRSLKEVSWITIKEKLYSFRPDDRSNRQSEKMYALLEDLIGRAKAAGYTTVADAATASTSDSSITTTEVPVDPEQAKKEPRAKKIEPLHHSENLAFAFGLLNTPEGAPIRIMKNTGICTDCHGAMKMFSALSGREIIIRDAKVLHVFLNGNCSCGDFSPFF